MQSGHRAARLPRWLLQRGAAWTAWIAAVAAQPWTPCTVHASAAAERAVAVRAVDAQAAGFRFSEAALLEGRHLPQGQPWSPDGKWLTVAHATGLALWNADEPAAAPRAILDADVMEVRWSPDGTWLCCRVRVLNGTRGGAVRFQFVAATGSGAEYRIPNAAIGNWIWADDGKVYFWNGDTGVRKEVAPPRSWLALYPQLPAPPRSHLVLAAGADRRRPRLRPLLFVPGPTPAETLLDSLYVHTAVQPWCRIATPAPDGPRWIVTTRDGRESETLLVNARGGRVTALQPGSEPALQHVSASADGGLVAGERCAAGDTARACARIWVGSLAAQSYTAMNWDGRNPTVAPQANHIAFETKTGHAVRVFAVHPMGAGR